MISLLFKILADAAGFNKVIKTDLPATAKEGGKKAGKEGGSEFGKEFGSQVKGAVMSMIGAGAILGAVKSQIQNAAKLTKEAAREGIPVEAMQELQRAAEATGSSIESLRDAAPEVASEFMALIEAIKASGGIIDAETVKRLSDLEKDLKSLTGSVAVIIGPIVTAVSTVLELLIRAGQVVGGSAFNLGGLAVGNSNVAGEGLRVIEKALTTPLNSLKSNNPVASAANSFNESERAQNQYKLERFTSFSNRLTSLSGTAGADRDASIFSMIPGASKELLQAIKDNTGKMESMKQTLEKKL
jgi:hypothetical protein